MGAVAEVTDATFADQVLASAKPVLVDYWAEWCAPCKQISPIIEELAGEYGDKVTFVKLNADLNTDTTIKYGILGLPTLQVFVGGDVVKQFQGGKTKAMLVRALEEYL
jgi:thioredoxin 1